MLGLVPAKGPLFLPLRGTKPRTPRKHPARGHRACWRGVHRNLFLVGDEDQSIYGFRAAWPQALMEFEKAWPGAQVLLMEQNYRSGTGRSWTAADRFAARNRYRRPKVDAGRRAAVPRARWRVVRISLAGGPVQLAVRAACSRAASPLAVLFRNNESALPLVDLCERHGVGLAVPPQNDLTVFQRHASCWTWQDLLELARRPPPLAGCSCGCTTSSGCPSPGGRRSTPAGPATAADGPSWRSCGAVPT